MSGVESPDADTLPPTPLHPFIIPDTPDWLTGDLRPLFETILDYVPAPVARRGPFQMLVSTLDHSPYVGRIAIGKIERGAVRPGQTVALLPWGEPGLVPEGTFPRAKVAQLHGFEGLARVEVEEASAGEIVALSGLEGIEIGQTVTDPEAPERLSGIAVEEPTITVDFSVNTGPFAGRDGRYVTSRQIRERLFREVERNVALRVDETDSPDTFRVAGRGELHLGILMETMRREGYEFLVSRPRVITREGPNGEMHEPYEELLIDVSEPFVGTVMEKLGPRRAELVDMRNPGHGTVRMAFRIPARGLFGYRSDFLTDTRGNGVMHHRFLEYGQWAGPLAGRNRGVMVSMIAGHRGGLRAVQSAGAGGAVRPPDGAGVRGHGDRGALPAGGPGRESGQGQADEQHAPVGVGRSRLAGTAPGHYPRTRSGVHRGRRVDRSHAGGGAAQEARPRPERAEATWPECPEGGGLMSRGPKAGSNLIGRAG